MDGLSWVLGPAELVSERGICSSLLFGQHCTGCVEFFLLLFAH